MKSEHRLYLIMSFCLIMLNPLAIDIYVPAVPALVDALQQQRNKFNLPSHYLSINCQLIAGPLSDRLGRGGIVIIGIILSMIGASIALQRIPLTHSILHGYCKVLDVVQSITAMAIVRDLFSAKRPGAGSVT